MLVDKYGSYIARVVFRNGFMGRFHTEHKRVDENENEEEMAIGKSEFSHEGLTENKKFRKKMFFRFERKLDIPDKNFLGNLGFWENTYNIAEHNPQNLGLL